MNPLNNLDIHNGLFADLGFWVLYFFYFKNVILKVIYIGEKPNLL